jgi:non-ribosomal peptide synthetase component F
MAPIAFDMATEEMIPPLMSGCTLVDVPTSLQSMLEFTNDVISGRYTILNLPAPLWQQWTTYLYAAHLSLPPDVRLVIVGSDKIYTRTYRLWQSLPGADHIRWVAAYGVTEATVTSLFYITAATDNLTDEPLIPIGKPIVGVAAYVLREDGTPTVEQESGELYIGGVGLARGYHGLPEKTAEVFVPDHFSKTPGARLYKTGDLVRRRLDGNLVWLGRKDSQIKINGLRIEPAEIEAVIHEYPGVAEAVVVYKSSVGSRDNDGLVAYVEPKPGVLPGKTKILAFLRTRLHPGMIPAHIVILPSIPLNANGKLDRKTLTDHITKEIV